MDYKFKSQQQIRNGLFLTLGLVLILFSIILAGGDKSFLTSYYSLKVKFKQVQGLSEGSVVSLAGIGVGNVKNIIFNPEEDLIELELSIDASYKKNITLGSKASVKTQGALGDKFIYITPGPMDGAPIAEDSYLSADNSADLFDVISEEGPKLVYILEVVNELKILLKNLNADDNSAKLMRNLVAATDKLDKFLGEGQGLLGELKGSKSKNLKESVTHLSSILAKIDKGEGTLGALINDPSLHEQIINLVGKRPRNSYLKPLIRATLKERDKETK